MRRSNAISRSATVFQGRWLLVVFAFSAKPTWLTAGHEKVIADNMTFCYHITRCLIKLGHLVRQILHNFPNFLRKIAEICGHIGTHVTCQNMHSRMTMGRRRARSQSQAWAACGSMSITWTKAKQIWDILYFPEVHDLFFFYYHFFILEQYRVTILSVFRFFFASYWTEVLSTFFSLGGGWDREEGKLPLAKFGYLPVLVFGDLRLWRGGTIKRYASSPEVSQIQKETANMNVLVSTSL